MPAQIITSKNSTIYSACLTEPVLENRIQFRADFYLEKYFDSIFRTSDESVNICWLIFLFLLLVWVMQLERMWSYLLNVSKRSATGTRVLTTSSQVFFFNSISQRNNNWKFNIFNPYKQQRSHNAPKTTATRTQFIFLDFYDFQRTYKVRGNTKLSISSDYNRFANGTTFSSKQTQPTTVRRLCKRQLKAGNVFTFPCSNSFFLLSYSPLSSCKKIRLPAGCDAKVIPFESQAQSVICTSNCNL